MSFRLRKDARAWFRDLRPSLDLDFDMYYFCLMVGLAARNKETIQQADTDEIVQYFPGEYGPRGRLIVAIFLKAELDGLGVKMTERAAVHETIRRLVSPTSPSYLSGDGEREINRYAHGGFEVLTEWFQERPRTLEVFLPMYFDRIRATEAA